MKSTVSFSLSGSNAEFLRKQANMSAFLDDLIGLYRKYKLRKEMREGYLAQDDEDVALAEASIEDFLHIIDDAEHTAV